ncbi:MAG: asparagine synthase (glutamine-hydrolyzing) [Gammaproteobacteria bacterium]
MCGIFGFYGFEDPSLLNKMSESIHHRGPDGQGFFSEGRFSMGMKRLSIIDLAGGTQPIFNEDRSIAICYNGEVYNFLELREELLRAGHQFKTHSDTEVIVHAYEEWGIDCLQRFNGMFGFAIYDARLRRVFIARDRCGQKPLYYYHKNGKFIFASEVKAILLSDEVSRDVNTMAIDPYLTLRYVPEPQTMFKDIYTLPAAHYLLLDANGEVTINRYWDIQLISNNQFLSPKASYEQLEHQLRQSVNLVMRSDVQVGSYLSGGIDSNLLVALMRENYSNINTYSIGFNSPIDETDQARETAQLLGTNHHETHCMPEDINLLPEVIYHMDRPVGDALIIAFYKLAQMASKDVKVVISGEGADEIFAGYQFHKVMQLFQMYFKIMPNFFHQKAVVPFLNAIPAGFLNHFFRFPAALGKEGKQSFVQFLANYQNNSMFSNYMALKTLWRPEARQQLYSDKFQYQMTHSWVPEVRDKDGKFLDRLLKLQWDEWLQDWAIIRQDKNAMAHSLEVRLPFLDHELIELAFKMPPKLKAHFMKDKIIERALAKHLLPKEIVKRPKKPFYFPMDYFFEHPQFNEWVKMTLNPEQVRKRGYFKPEYVANLLEKMKTREFIYLKQVASLVILELWHMVFIDKSL